MTKITTEKKYNFSPCLSIGFAMWTDDYSPLGILLKGKITYIVLPFMRIMINKTYIFK